MKTYQIEIKDAVGIPVKRFHFTYDEPIAYALLDDWAARYDSSHTLELSTGPSELELSKRPTSGTRRVLQTAKGRKRG